MDNFSNLYSKQVLDHFRNPRNMGEMKDPDATATVGGAVCGDIMRLFIKVGEKQGKKYIQDVKFQTLGCVAAIATSSIITTMIKSKTLDEAEKITQQTVEVSLGGLPPAKRHCALLAAQGVKKALDNYFEKKK